MGGVVAQEGGLGGVRWVIQELNKEMGHVGQGQSTWRGKEM